MRKHSLSIAGLFRAGIAILLVVSGVTPIGGCAGGNTHDQYHHVEFTQTLVHVHVPDIELGDGVEGYRVTYAGGFRSGWGGTPPEWPNANDAHDGSVLVITEQEGSPLTLNISTKVRHGGHMMQNAGQYSLDLYRTILYSDDNGVQTTERYYVTTIEYEMKADGSLVDKDGNPLSLDDDNPPGTEGGSDDESEDDGEDESGEE